MPLIHDGVYKIHNFKYSHTKELKDQQVADLVNGGPGPIDGRRDYLAHNDQWCIKNKYHEATSNSVTIENFEHRGVYAEAILKDGSSVVGKKHSNPHDATVWTLVARGGGKYNIQAPYPHNDLIWELTAPNANIKLGDYRRGTQDYNEWTFQDLHKKC